MTADSASRPSSRVGCSTPRRPHLVDEGQVLGADRRQREALVGLLARQPGLHEQVAEPARARPCRACRRSAGCRRRRRCPMPAVEALGDLAVVDLDDHAADGEPGEDLGHDQRHLGLEVRRQLADVDDVDVGLGELAVAPLLGTLAAPHLLDLVAAEREGQVPGVLQHVAREGHGEVEVQAELGVAARPRPSPASRLHARRSPCRRRRPCRAAARRARPHGSRSTGTRAARTSRG